MVPGAIVKLADIRNPVKSDWLIDQGFRLDASPYLSGAYESRKLLEQLPGSQPLNQLVRQPLGIFHAGRVTRRWVSDSRYGIQFLSSTDILEADLSNLSLISNNAAENNNRLLIKRDWTLITRSGQVLGRVCYARSTMDGMACTEDVLRVVPNRDKIQPGYLNAFLASRYGVSAVVNSKYGTSIPHLEPPHLADLSVPRFDRAVEEEIHECVQAAADLRARFQAGVTAATRDLFESAGVPELLDLRWHEQPRELGFEVQRPEAISLRALNFSPRANRLIECLRDIPHRSLGDICRNGKLQTGARFKRIDANPAYGVRLIGQRQAFWVQPEGRWINPNEAPADILQYDETVLIAAHGTLGENEVFGRSILVTGSWVKHAYSQDFVRVLSGTPDVSGAYLFAFLRSDVAFRLLRSMSVGGKQQEYHSALLREMPIPECTPADRERIAETVRQAYRWRDEADELEDRAQELLNVAVRDAVGTALRQDGALIPKMEEAGKSGDGSDHRRRRARQRRRAHGHQAPARPRPGALGGAAQLRPAAARQPQVRDRHPRRYRVRGHAD
jgi:type I restriction enzyme S subunit